MVIDVAREIAVRPTNSVPLYDAVDLTKDGTLAQIQLGEQIYTLRITRAGKLILTK